LALKACLDTRFYFAHYSKEAPSWTRRIVADSRSGASLLVSSTVTVTELVSSMAPSVGLETVQIRVDSAKDAGIRLISPTEEIARHAGEMILKDRDLPMADAIIAATAIAHSVGRVYTDDPHFEKILGIQTVWGRA
jgi:predicted nucleic acid-binding protein